MFKKGGRSLRRFLGIFVILFSLIPVAALCSEIPRSHRVEKGDTLWDLSERYYGDRSLWPKLWQMNPFVTNPHLLKEGDVLELTEEPAKEAVEGKNLQVDQPEPVTADPEPAKKKGFDVSSLVDEAYAGFFSFEPVVAAGRITADETIRLMLAGGDSVFVNFCSENAVTKGDAFMVYRTSKPFTDPMDRKRRGCAVNFIGRVLVSEQIDGPVFRAVIKDARREITIGDPLIAASAKSSCFEVVSPTEPVEGVIIASRHARELIGHLDVVYLNKGRLDGLQRGNVMHIQGDMQELKSTCDTPLPISPLGSLVVLAVTAESATALVVEANQEVPRGSVVRTVSGGEAEAVVSRLPACSLSEDTEKNVD